MTGIRARSFIALLASGLWAATSSLVAAQSPPPVVAPVLATAPAPLTAAGVPVDWLFVFKLNAAIFPSTAALPDRPCPFGGTAQPYAKFSQAYASANSQQPELTTGVGLLGSATTDPLGATFAQIYFSGLHYVVWNDQFYSHPPISGCSDSCSAPWGHSKGVVAWNDAGDGVVLQVTTPSWPAAGSAARPRTGDGNTLGCISDNDVKVSQDFFALRLTEADLEKVLDALISASVATNAGDPQIVSNGGPSAIQQRVAQLGVKSPTRTVFNSLLSTGVRLIGKPSTLHVPPWQLVSSVLGGVDLRTATWWTNPAIPSTTRQTAIACWSPELTAPGAVEIATSGHWAGQAIGLKGGPEADGNHAKIGVSISGKANYTIFGDMNQQGTLSGNCASSQNGRGGLFFVIDNSALNSSVASLIDGATAAVPDVTNAPVAPVPCSSSGVRRRG